MTTTYNLEDVDVVHDPVNKKYDAWHQGDVVGVLVYERIGGHITISHAAVDQNHRGHGIGGKLIGFALDDLESLGSPISVLCPIVRDFIERHPQYAHLLDRSSRPS